MYTQWTHFNLNNGIWNINEAELKLPQEIFCIGLFILMSSGGKGDQLFTI